VDKAGLVEEIPDQLEISAPGKVKILCNPAKSWHVLSAPIKPNSGPFVQLVVPSPLLRKERVLTPWLDWIQSDPFREGGEATTL
jgi:hypothetical protein